MAIRSSAASGRRATAALTARGWWRHRDEVVDHGGHVALREDRSSGVVPAIAQEVEGLPGLSPDGLLN
eukprot:10112629-Alexandrium_andersonii.AAC.1